MRIQSIEEFEEKMDLAFQIRDKIKDGTATEQNLTMFSVLNSELQEYKPVIQDKQKLFREITK